MPRIALPPIASWSSIGTGLTAADGKIGLTLWGRTIFSDDFSDSSLNGTYWNSITAGAGTVTETTSLACDSSAANTDAAAVGYKTVLSATKTGKWKVKVKMTCTSYTGNYFGIGFWNSATALSAATASSTSAFFPMFWFSSATGLRIAGNFPGFVYASPAIGGGTWGTSAATVTLSAATAYWYTCSCDGENLQVAVYSDNEVTILSGFPITLNLDSLHFAANGHVVYLGDIHNNLAQGITTFGLFEHKGAYVTTSPEADTGWFAVDQAALDGTNPLALVSVVGGAGANIKCQYQKNGVDTWLPAATWSTLADVNTDLQSDAVTDHTSSLRFKFQFNSDGHTQAELIVGGHALADAVTAGSGGLVIHGGMSGGMRG